MADFNYSSNQAIRQSQSQKQIQGISQKQITALKFLTIPTKDLRDIISKAVEENPVLEIVSRKQNRHDENFRMGNSEDADKNQMALENVEDERETLQEHLLQQLRVTKMSQDEFELSERLIGNLDKTGCYGSLLSPESLLDKTRPMQNERMLKKCMDRIQRMDPIGTCCKDINESLYIQAKIHGNASDLTLFILDGKLEFIESKNPKKIIQKLNEYRRNWHKKEFAPEIVLDKIKLTEQMVEETIDFILKLNPIPSQGYLVDTSFMSYNLPDVVLSVKRYPGFLIKDNYSLGLVHANDSFHFQVQYASGILPELRISKEFLNNKEMVAKNKDKINDAKNFLDILAFRESSLVLQGCAIVNAQREFFLKGKEYLKPLTRREIAKELGINESTVSRLSSKKGSKFIDTEFGSFPISFFFSSGISTVEDENKKISSEVIKLKMQEIMADEEKTISDLQLTKMLNKKGIKIARRTVSKYRNQLGIENSYKR